jgi:hypothetical protein
VKFGLLSPGRARQRRSRAYPGQGGIGPFQLIITDPNPFPIPLTILAAIHKFCDSLAFSTTFNYLQIHQYYIFKFDCWILCFLHSHLIYVSFYVFFSASSPHPSLKMYFSFLNFLFRLLAQLQVFPFLFHLAISSAFEYYFYVFLKGEYSSLSIVCF